MDLHAVCRTLKSLESKEEDILFALKDVKQILTSDKTDGIRQNLLHDGIIKCIVGFLRCSNNIDVLISATNCLILAVLGSKEVCYKVSELNLVQLILTLYTSVTNKKGIQYYTLQEQLISLLRKVTCNCEPNHTLFVHKGGIAMTIKLIKDQYLSSIDSYSPDTKKRLTELTVGKCFIAAVSKVPSEHKQYYCNTIPALVTLGETFIQLYPLFFIDLSNSDNRYITDILTNEGLALPDETSFITSKEEVSWVILRVTHVSGSVKLWGEFSVDKKDKEHWEMFERFHKDAPPQMSTAASPTNLVPGSVYSIYNSVVTSAPIGWYRGWFLSSNNGGSNNSQFFCMDYGFTISVKKDNVRQLPPQFKGIRPRAAPCILTGIRPPLKSIKMLEDCTGLLRNLSFEKDDYLKEMLTQGYVPLLLDLISNRPITREAIRHCMICLMNLCQLEQVCSLMCKLGAIQILTNLFLALGHKFEATVQKCLLGCLQNIVIRDKQSVEIFQNIKGPTKLKTWIQEQDSTSIGDIDTCIAKLLTAIEESERNYTTEPSTFTSWMVTTNRTPPLTHSHLSPHTTTTTHSPAHVIASPLSPTMSSSIYSTTLLPTNTNTNNNTTNTPTMRSPIYSAMKSPIYATTLLSSHTNTNTNNNTTNTPAMRSPIYSAMKSPIYATTLLSSHTNTNTNNNTTDMNSTIHTSTNTTNIPDMCSPIHTRTAMEKQKSPNSKLHSTNALKVNTSPVYRIKSQDNNKFYSTQKHLEGLSPSRVPDVNYGYYVPVPSNEAIEYINVDITTNISLGHMLRSVCGIANTETGGCILIGVSENGRAKGISLSRNERNNIRLDVDQLVTQFIPPIISSRYNITFIPVTGSPRKKEQFIVSIRLSPSSFKAVHLVRMKGKDGRSNEECYIHSNGRSIKISLQEVREIVAEKEFKAFLNSSGTLS